MFAAIALLLAAATAAASPDSSRPRVHLDIDVESTVSVSADDLRAMMAVVSAIWRPLVDVSASLPGAPAGASDTLRVIITNRQLETRDTGLAWIAFVDGEPQKELTVSMRAVLALLANGRWQGRRFDSLPMKVSHLFVQRAVGWAIAHEIGHYLLRSRLHERTGLMRAVFTVDEIMDARLALGQAARAYAMRSKGGEELAARMAN